MTTDLKLLEAYGSARAEYDRACKRLARTVARVRKCETTRDEAYAALLHAMEALGVPEEEMPRR